MGHSTSLALQGASGFLTLIQCLQGPETSGFALRLETIPSNPILQAAANLRCFSPVNRISHKIAVCACAVRTARLDDRQTFAIIGIAIDDDAAVKIFLSGGTEELKHAEVSRTVMTNTSPMSQKSTPRCSKQKSL